MQIFPDPTGSGSTKLRWANTVDTYICKRHENSTRKGGSADAIQGQNMQKETEKKYNENFKSENKYAKAGKITAKMACH
jgi:hypothetical protein